MTIQSVFDYSETSKYLRSSIFLLLKGNVIMDYIENISQKEPVPSYLPSWVIKMREKIEVSRLAHTNTEQRLQGLHDGMDALTIQLNLREKSKKQCLNNVEKSRLEKENQLKPIKKEVILYFIPSEVLLNVFEYLNLVQIIRMDILSKTMRTIISSSRYWKQSFQLYCPHLTHNLIKTHKNTVNTASMILLRKYLYDCKISISFLQLMKDQRCIPKHRSIQPHRHTRQERQITHPLPLFQHNHNNHTGSNSSQSLSTITTTATTSSMQHKQNNSQDMIMSHAETLSSDFRSLAHKSLNIILIQTSDISNPVCYKLLYDGIITIMISLLQNEEGAIQNYASSILANMLCWEAYIKYKVQSTDTTLTGTIHCFNFE